MKNFWFIFRSMENISNKLSNESEKSTIFVKKKPSERTLRERGNFSLQLACQSLNLLLATWFFLKEIFRFLRATAWSTHGPGRGEKEQRTKMQTWNLVPPNFRSAPDRTFYFLNLGGGEVWERHKGALLPIWWCHHLKNSKLENVLKTTDLPIQVETE